MRHSGGNASVAEPHALNIRPVKPDVNAASMSKVRTRISGIGAFSCAMQLQVGDTLLRPLCARITTASRAHRRVSALHGAAPRALHWQQPEAFMPLASDESIMPSLAMSQSSRRYK